MENDPEVLATANQLALKFFELDLSEKQESFDGLKQKLSRIISYLLDRDFERLLRIMYRIDIDENKFKWSLTQESPSDRISELVVERLIKKAQTWVQYKNTN